MTAGAVALVVGLCGPWAVARLTRRGGTPHLAVAGQIACLLLAWSGALIVVADLAAPSAGVFRACSTVVTALLRGDPQPAGVLAAVVYGGVVGRTAWCLAAVSSRSWRTVASIRAVAHHDGATLTVPTGSSVGFTAGLIRPFVVVSDDLFGDLDEATRDVVLSHELAHARGRHTAVDLLTRALVAGLAPWPGARVAMVEVRRNLEAAADDFAAHQFGAEGVARAIGRVALMPKPSLAPGTLGATGFAVWRVRRLLHPHRVPGWRRMPASAAAASSLVVGAQGAAHATMGAHLLPLAMMCHL